MNDLQHSPVLTDPRLHAMRCCHTCAQACEHCAASCLREPELARMAPCILADLDCVDICRATAGLIARNNRFAAGIAQLCAAVCQECADICSQHDRDHCQACAAACRECADACLLLAAA